MRYHLGTHIIRLESRPSVLFNHKFSVGGAEERTTPFSARIIPRMLSQRCCRAMRKMRTGGGGIGGAAWAHRYSSAGPEIKHTPSRKLLHTKRKELALLAQAALRFQFGQKFKEGKQTFAGCCAGVECSTPFCPIYGTDIRNTLPGCASVIQI